MANATGFRISSRHAIEGSRELADHAGPVPKPDWQRLTFLDGRRGSLSGGRATSRRRGDSPIARDGGPQEPGDKLGQAPGLERFRDESDAPGPHEPVRLGGRPGRERDHGDPAGRGVGLQRLDDRQAVHLGHVVVDQDQVGALSSRQLEPVTPLRGVEDAVAVGTEELGERAQDELVIVDDQD